MGNSPNYVNFHPAKKRHQPGGVLLYGLEGIRLLFVKKIIRKRCVIFINEKSFIGFQNDCDLIVLLFCLLKYRYNGIYFVLQFSISDFSADCYFSRQIHNPGNCIPQRVQIVSKPIRQFQFCFYNIIHFAPVFTIRKIDISFFNDSVRHSKYPFQTISTNVL